MADLIRYAFIGGEISPTLLSRSDLEKFDLAVALATNWFVDYRGGLSTRPGQKFVDLVEHDDQATKFFPFAFGPDTAQTYVILIGSDYIRFIQDGAYVLEDEVAITGVTQADLGVVAAAAHGFSEDDWVKVFNVEGMTELNGRTFRVGAVTTDTFELLDPLLTEARTETAGVTDDYSDEDDVDTVTSTNESYDAANDLYSPTSTQTQITWTTPTNIGDLTVGGGLAAGFDGVTSQGVVSGPRKSGSNPGWIGRYKSGDPKTVTGFRVYAPNDQNINGGNASGAAGTVKLYGKVTGQATTSTDGVLLYSASFTDGTNGVGGNIIEVLSGITAQASESVFVRIDFGANTTYDVNLAEVQFLEGTGVGNMTLASDAFTASTVPTTARVALFIDPQESITVNTDLTVEVSRDGGTSWTTAVLVLAGTVGSVEEWEDTAIDLTAQASGTSMKYRIKTLNNKDIDVTGIELDWAMPSTVGVDIDTSAYTAYTSGGVAQRIYTVASPYAATDLEMLRGHQSRSVVYFTHKDYAPRILTRVAHTNWTLAEVVFGNNLTRPTISSVNAGTGSAGVGFKVTAVDINGKESLPSDYVFDTTAIDYSSTAGQAKVAWNNITGAVLYRVYRTNIIQTGADVSRAMQVGFVGYAYGTEFIDNNIIPDFTVTPPTHIDPFANGSIEFIQVTAGGTGYTTASAVTITTSTGSGFVGYPVVSSGGALLALIIINGGEGYVDADTVNVSVGTGATFTKTLSPASGNDPRVSGTFQQRKVYAGSENDPITVWASQPGEYEVMDVATIVQEDDAYEFELDTEQVAPIEHLLSTRSGMVILSQTGIWQLTGGQGVAVTPTNALADPQSYTGCSNLPPLAVDTDIVYQEGKGSTVRLLSYNDFTKVFAGQDLSILSNHLTKPAKPIKAWAYASDPFKLVHAVRSDGQMVVLTLVKEQNVYGWTRFTTKGLYKDVIAIQEGRTDVVYLMVQRYINGRWTKMIELMDRREFEHVEDAWCVDAGLSNTHTFPAAGLAASAATGTGVVFTADAAVFTSGDVGKILRIGGGKAVITAFTDTTHVVGTFMRDVTNLLPEDESDQPLPALSGEWTLDTPISTVTGLWHLVGETVKVLADGNVLPDKVVSATGTVDLGVEATSIIIGLGYKCIGRSLPPTAGETIIEGKRKRPVGMTARVYETRGLKFGAKLTNLYPFKERTDEAYAEPTRLQSGMKPLVVQAEFDREGQFYFVEEDPLPATLLGFVLDLDVGDVDRRGR